MTHTDRNRQPAGNPDGGQFAKTAGAEATTIVLTKPREGDLTVGDVVVLPGSFKRARVTSIDGTEYECHPIDGAGKVTITVAPGDVPPEVLDGGREFALRCVGAGDTNPWVVMVDADSVDHARELAAVDFADVDVVSVTEVDQWALVEGGLVEDCSDGVASVDMDIMRDHVMDEDWLDGAEHALHVLKHFQLRGRVDELEPLVRQMRPYFDRPTSAPAPGFNTDDLTGFVVLRGGIVQESSDNVATIDTSFMESDPDSDDAEGFYVAETAARFSLTNVVERINKWWAD